MATDQENNQRFTLTKTVSVYPKALHPPTLLSLSNIDRHCPALTYLVLFYPSRTHQNTSAQSLFRALKIGMEETLSIWFPAAGRITFNQTDGRLDLLCNNAGAVLVEKVTQLKISEIGDLSQYNEFYENLVCKPVFNGNFSEMPLVTAQVTMFGCGGYAVGVGTSHALFDASATFNFLSVWASKTTMRVDGGSDELHEAVLHDRGPLLVGFRRSQHHITRLHNKPNHPVTRVAAFDHLHLLMKQAASDWSLDSEMMLGGCKLSEMASSSQENYTPSSFHVGSEMVESLKRKTSHACSSFDVVTAHLWKARTKTLGLRKERMVCLQFAVDARNRMVPPLPRGFSGNAYVLASVCCTAGELEGASYDSIIQKIMEAKRSVNNDYVNAYLETLEALPPQTSPQASLPPLKELTMVSDWTRTPFHKVDFGQGEAASASPLVYPLPQVAFFMQKPQETRSIDVRIGLLPQYLKAFSHYFLTELQ